MSLPRPDYLIVSCEHGGNRVPSPFSKLFSRRFLDTHRGYDPGALAVARDFAAATGAPLFYSTVSRLLVELNRPLGHPQLFHLPLPEPVREALLRRYYFPYWNAVHKAAQRGRRVLHLSCHSFTPKFRGVRRATDIGLLFDPARPAEAAFCRRWRRAILEEDPHLRVRYNDPYPGVFPSLVESLRRKLGGRRYVGIQIEVNQKFPRGDARRWRALRRALVAAFTAVA
ncbi:MAG TPA: N-formylglutamate amidohydrolase [Burkholderiales bacterium]|jgi:predicted N-formylglutamate amidohydrolase